MVQSHPHLESPQDGIILVYDICDRESFKHVDEWLNEVNRVLADKLASELMDAILSVFFRQHLHMVESGESQSLNVLVTQPGTQQLQAT